MPSVRDIKNVIEKGSAAALAKEKGPADEPRGYLGASVAGKPCPRQLWYDYRWFRGLGVSHTARLQRLFDRGHDEELRVHRWLIGAGFEVQAYSNSLHFNPETKDYASAPWGAPVVAPWQDVSDSALHRKMAAQWGTQSAQWRFDRFGGHYGGSSDGRVRVPENLAYAGKWVLLEVKTHNSKSFTLLQQKGVITSKPVHFTQMQLYMHEFELPAALYIAVNKNDDDIYAEFVTYKPELAQQYTDRVRGILESQAPPKRISDDSSWWECRFCDYSELCHHGKAASKNCRTCVMSKPVLEGDGGVWRCDKFNQDIPSRFQPLGCESWEVR